MTSDPTPTRRQMPSQRGRGDSQGRAKLGRWARILLVTCGVLMVATGGLAVFYRDVEAGPTALITVGAIMVVIGASGMPLQSIKFGENEIQLSPEAAQEIEERIEQSPPEQALAIFQGAAAADPAVFRDRGILMAAAGSFSWLIQDQLKSMFRTIDVKTTGIGGFDAVLKPSRHAVAVEAYFSSGEGDQLSTPRVWHTVDRRLFHGENVEVKALALVSLKQLSPEQAAQIASRLAQRGIGFRFVQWVDSAVSASELKQAVEDLSRQTVVPVTILSNPVDNQSQAGPSGGRPAVSTDARQ